MLLSIIRMSQMIISVGNEKMKPYTKTTYRHKWKTDICYMIIETFSKTHSNVFDMQFF